MINNTAADPPISGNQRVYVITERIILFTLVIYALFAPHSIAITQGSFLLGLLAWGVQSVSVREFRLKRTPIDIALLGFFACCVVSSFLSYVPLVSIKGLRSPAFFLAFYFVSSKVKSVRFACVLALALIGSCLVNIGYSAGKLAVGRGLQIDSIRPGSPFAKEDLRVGDVILEADGQKVKSAEDLSRIVDSQRGRLGVKFQRNEWVGEASVSRRAIRKSDKAGTERLGIATSPGRSFRVTGFYSHYETYAEVLQLIAALAIGMLIAHPRKRSGAVIFLGISAALIAATIILTSTRAAMIGLALGVAVMSIISYRRRVVVISLLAILALAPVALFALERSRGISLIDPTEGSTAYRLEVWREAMGLIKDHPLVGIGKGSEGKLKESRGLYDNGKLPPGHFHSTLIQVATWWGLPALAFYVAFMTILFLESWKLSKKARFEKRWDVWGLTLGGTGAIVAFNVSSVAHFNFGDGEVVMAIWFVTGLVFAVRRLTLDTSSAPKPEHKPALPLEYSSDKNQRQAQEIASESNVRAAKVTQNSR